MTEAIAETFTRESLDSRVMVLDGHDLSLSVRKGYLIAEDGMCGYRRERKVPRSSRDIKRVVIIAHSGNITLSALRWMREVNTTSAGTQTKHPITLTVVEPNGELLYTSARSAVDNKLLRAQAQVADDPVTAREITKYLMSSKLLGHDSVLPYWDSTPWLKKLNAAKTLTKVRNVEREEAKEYFEQWIGLPIKIKGRSVPNEWRTFDKRRSTLNPTKNQNAGHPINALLNYSYWLAKAEIRIACYVNGLEPGLGINHTDYMYADALVMDLVEAIRPDVERYIMELIHSRTFDRESFILERNGKVRLARPLTHEINEQALLWQHVAKPVVDHVTTAVRSGIEGWTPEKKRQAGTAKKTGPKPLAA